MPALPYPPLWRLSTTSFSLLGSCGPMVINGGCCQDVSSVVIMIILQGLCQGEQLARAPMMIILRHDGCCNLSRKGYTYLLSSSEPIMVTVIISHVRSGNALQPDFNQMALHSKKHLFAQNRILLISVFKKMVASSACRLFFATFNV